MRADGRARDELRPVTIERGWLKFAAGSALIQTGKTRLLCAASVVENIPDWLVSAGQGWVTAEYGMLPASTARRRQRPRFAPDGRSQEIQRLVGRCLRAVTNLKSLGERTIWIDCDVIEADGGTRTAAVTGAYVALYDALLKLVDTGAIEKIPLLGSVAAVSVGLVGGEVILDLDYAEDSAAEVDMNIVMTGAGKFVEIQGTAEKTPFDFDTFDEMVKLARKGVAELTAIQRRCIERAAML